MRGLRVDSFRVLELGVGVVVIGCGDFGAALSLKLCAAVLKPS